VGEPSLGAIGSSQPNFVFRAIASSEMAGLRIVRPPDLELVELERPKMACNSGFNPWTVDDGLLSVDRQEPLDQVLSLGR
jgi:hypothetical protein